MTLILGLETSCDETAASVVEDGRRVLSNVVSSQHELHEKYRGVVPEIASRAHLERMLPVIDEALTRAGLSFSSPLGEAGWGALLPSPSGEAGRGASAPAATAITAIAVGNRPGLIGSLLVGVSAAKALAWSLGVPLIGVDHIQAHLYAAALESEERGAKSEGREDLPNGNRSSLFAPRSSIAYPALGLVVSGGHTSLYAVSSPTRMRVIGQTIDDAVGEAYDKAAVILDAGYPGGQKLDALARTGDPRAESLPRSLLSADSLDFSFSGLKTALLYKVRGHPIGRGGSAAFTRSSADLSHRRKADLAAAFQHAAVETLVIKLERALDFLASRGEAARCVVIGGGVSANSLLREAAGDLGKRRGVPVRIPALEFCLDNAAMIAGLAHHHLAAGHTDGLDLPAMASSSA